MNPTIDPLQKEFIKANIKINDLLKQKEQAQQTIATKQQELAAYYVPFNANQKELSENVITKIKQIEEEISKANKILNTVEDNLKILNLTAWKTNNELMVQLFKKIAASKRNYYQSNYTISGIIHSIIFAKNTETIKKLEAEINQLVNILVNEIIFYAEIKISSYSNSLIEKPTEEIQFTNLLKANIESLSNFTNQIKKLYKQMSIIIKSDIPYWHKHFSTNLKNHEFKLNYYLSLNTYKILNSNKDNELKALIHELFENNSPYIIRNQTISHWNKWINLKDNDGEDYIIPNPQKWKERWKSLGEYCTEQAKGFLFFSLFFGIFVLMPKITDLYQQNKSNKLVEHILDYLAPLVNWKFILLISPIISWQIKPIATELIITSYNDITPNIKKIANKTITIWETLKHNYDLLIKDIDENWIDLGLENGDKFNAKTINDNKLLPTEQPLNLNKHFNLS